MTPLVRIHDLCLHLNGRAILHRVVDANGTVLFSLYHERNRNDTCILIICHLRTFKAYGGTGVVHSHLVIVRAGCKGQRQQA